MNSVRFIFSVLLLALLVHVLPLGAQSTVQGEEVPSKAFDMSDFPLWSKEVRRAEIVAFGSLPFTVFAATFFTDLYRCAEHDWDSRYAPWPLKGAGAINMSSDDFKMTLLYAGIASISISLIDFGIVHLRQYIEKRRAAGVAPDDTEIRRKPLPRNDASSGADSVDSNPVESGN